VTLEEFPLSRPFSSSHTSTPHDNRAKRGREKNFLRRVIEEQALFMHTYFHFSPFHMHIWEVEEENFRFSIAERKNFSAARRFEEAKQQVPRK
jgi:hypothetical protein